jgi:hypothetical protein
MFNKVYILITNMSLRVYILITLFIDSDNVFVCHVWDVFFFSDILVFGVPKYMYLFTYI